MISSDSSVDEQTKESYYLVTIKTEESTLQKGKDSLPIIPGMVASVDIITGKKSVLSYVLNPSLRPGKKHYANAKLHCLGPSMG